MKKMIGIGTSLLILAFVGLGYLTYKGAWLSVPIAVTFFVALGLLLKANSEYYRITELDEKLLLMHPIYNAGVKNVKAYKLDGYLIWVAEGRLENTDARIGIVDGKDIFLDDYSTLRKDNPNYDKAKELIAKKEETQ